MSATKQEACILADLGGSVLSFCPNLSPARLSWLFEILALPFSGQHVLLRKGDVSACGLTQAAFSAFSRPIWQTRDRNLGLAT